jgi:hypothetical protein
MKRGIITVSALALLLVAAGVASQVNAACSAAVEIGTQTGTSAPYYVYTVAPAGASTNLGAGGASRHGAFWEPGFRATQHSGTYDASNWWISFDGGVNYGWYLRANLTDNRVAGCPGAPNTFGGDGAGVNELLVVLQDRSSNDSFISVNRVRFDITQGRQFNMGSNSPEPWTALTMVPVPKPFVTSSGRSGPTVTLNVQLADVATAFQGYMAGGMPFPAHASITGYELCSQERTNVAPAPTRLVSDGWACTDVGTTQPGGRAVVRQETCGSPSNRRYVATRLVIDGVAAGPTDVVSKIVAVECNPTMATPSEIEQRRPDRPATDLRPGAKSR